MKLDVAEPFLGIVIVFYQGYLLDFESLQFLHEIGFVEVVGDVREKKAGLFVVV